METTGGMKWRRGSEHRRPGGLGVACTPCSPTGETSGSERGSTGAWEARGSLHRVQPAGRDERERARQHRSLGRLGGSLHRVQPAGRDERERARQHRSLGGSGQPAPRAARKGETSGSERGSTGAWEARGSLHRVQPAGRDERERARQHRSLGGSGQPAPRAARRARRAGASEAIFDGDHRRNEMEAGVGIEPTHGAFAEPGLTTWLPRREKSLPIHVDRGGDNGNLARTNQGAFSLV